MASPTAGILKQLGLIGASGGISGLVPRPDTQAAQQQMFSDFRAGGQVDDPDIWARYNTVMRRPVTFESMLLLWEEMAGWDLLAAALVEIVDEATQADANSPATLWYECNDPDFQDELNDLLGRLDAETLITSQVWHVAALGNHLEKIDYSPGTGVTGLTYVHPLDVRRYWLKRNRQCVGFRWANHRPDKDNAWVRADNKTPIERVAINDGQNIENLWYPWDFMHMRRMFRMRMTEHGEPVFDEAQGIYKKIRIAVDQMVVHRAQIQPDRYAVNIDVQEQPPTEQMKTVQRWKQALRSKLAFGAGGQPGEFGAPTDFQSYYNAMSLDTVLWVARPKGFQHAVEKIAGTASVPDVYDIELLTDLFFSIIGMPKSWLGVGAKGGGDNPPSGKALLAQDMRFLRKVKSIRRPIINAYTWLGYFHAVLKGKDPARLDIKAKMTPIGGLEEQMKLELLRGQAEVLSVLGDVMDKYNLPKEAWVETIFKRYMHLPDDVTNVFATALPNEAEPAGQAEGIDPDVSRLARPAPTVAKLIQEIDQRVGNNTAAAWKVRELREIVNGTSEPRERFKPYRTTEAIMTPPKLADNDLVVSSFGKDPFVVAGGKAQVQDSAKSAASDPAYRRYLPESF